MNVKDVLDNLNIVVDIPQHWYSTEVDNSFEKMNIIFHIMPKIVNNYEIKSRKNLLIGQNEVQEKKKLR